MCVALEANNNEKKSENALHTWSSHQEEKANINHITAYI